MVVLTIAPVSMPENNRAALREGPRRYGAGSKSLALYDRLRIRPLTCDHQKE